jgi:hypothetical protein
VSKESNQCVHPHDTSVSTFTCTYVYHQGHITDHDVGDNKCLERLTRYALFEQFMTDTLQDTLLHQRLSTLSTLSSPNQKSHMCFQLRGTTLVLSDTKDKIISLTVLLKDDFKVEFETGTSDEPNFGGYLITPAGSRVSLVFENNLWRVPLWAPPIRAPARHTISVKVLIKSGTTNFPPVPCLLKISNLCQLFNI